MVWDCHDTRKKYWRSLPFTIDTDGFFFSLTRRAGLRIRRKLKCAVNQKKREKFQAANIEAKLGDACRKMQIRSWKLINGPNSTSSFILDGRRCAKSAITCLKSGYSTKMRPIRIFRCNFELDIAHSRPADQFELTAVTSECFDKQKNATLLHQNLG